jgi:hypothetical protein
MRSRSKRRARLSSMAWRSRSNSDMIGSPLVSGGSMSGLNHALIHGHDGVPFFLLMRARADGHEAAMTAPSIRRVRIGESVVRVTTRQGRPSRTKDSGQERNSRCRRAGVHRGSWAGHSAV